MSWVRVGGVGWRGGAEGFRRNKGKWIYRVIVPGKDKDCGHWEGERERLGYNKYLESGRYYTCKLVIIVLVVSHSRAISQEERFPLAGRFLIKSGFSYRAVCHVDQAGNLMLDWFKHCVSLKFLYRNFPCVLAKQPDYGVDEIKGSGYIGW